MRFASANKVAVALKCAKKNLQISASLFPVNFNVNFKVPSNIGIYLIKYRITHLPGFHKVGEILHDTFRECHFQSRVVFRKMAKSLHPQRRPEDEWKFFAVHRAHLL